MRARLAQLAAMHSRPSLLASMQVAAALWVLLLREAALPQHLEAVKDYFLLGAGNFFQAFLQEARSGWRYACRGLWQTDDHPVHAVTKPAICTESTTQHGECAPSREGVYTQGRSSVNYGKGSFRETSIGAQSLQT